VEEFDDDEEVAATKIMWGQRAANCEPKMDKTS
jgi:hypothetical protein